MAVALRYGRVPLSKRLGSLLECVPRRKDAGGPRAPEALHPGGHKYHRWQLPFIRRYSIEPSTAHLLPCHFFGNPISSVAAAYYPGVDKCESTAISLHLWRGRGILFRRE